VSSCGAPMAVERQRVAIPPSTPALGPPASIVTCCADARGPQAAGAIQPDTWRLPSALNSFMLIDDAPSV
jgi:hypothetical protein